MLLGLKLHKRKGSIVTSCFGKRICGSTVEACEPVFRHISRVCGMASSVRIEVFRTASTLCNLVNKVVYYAARQTQ